MYKDHCSRLLSYNLWANQRIVDMTVKLAEQEFNKEISSSFPSIRLTLMHIWDAEVIWFERLKGNFLKYFPSRDFIETFKVAQMEFLNNSQAFLEHVSGMTENMVNEKHEYYTLNGKPYSHPVYDIIQHVVNHGTFHRGQIVTMLRQIGVTDILSTDFIDFSRLNEK